MKSKTGKPYWEMDLEELREATRQFDGPLDLSKTRPLSRSERQRFDKARKAPSRSLFVSRTRRRDNACQLCVEIDPRLLSRCVKYASAHNISLSELVARSLKSSMSFVG